MQLKTATQVARLKYLVGHDSLLLYKSWTHLNPEVETVLEVLEKNCLPLQNDTNQDSMLKPYWEHAVP